MICVSYTKFTPCILSRQRMESQQILKESSKRGKDKREREREREREGERGNRKGPAQLNGTGRKPKFLVAILSLYEFVDKRASVGI